MKKWWQDEPILLNIDRKPEDPPLTVGEKWMTPEGIRGEIIARYVPQNEKDTIRYVMRVDK